MAGEISAIYRYPVKGLSPEKMTEVPVEEGGALPGDRRFALAHGSTTFDAASPHWLPKTSFHALMKDEKLAALETAFDEETGMLVLKRGGKQVAQGKITDPIGKAIMEDFFSAFLREVAHGKPRFVESTGESIFTDQKKKVLSLINMASVRDLERVVGKPIDPIRFRGNIYLEGLEPWAELNWVSHDISIGNVGLNIHERTERCAATSVNPDTGERDMNLMKALQAGFGHTDMGVFATVTQAGTLAVGDQVIL